MPYVCQFSPNMEEKCERLTCRISYMAIAAAIDQLPQTSWQPGLRTGEPAWHGKMWLVSGAAA